MRYVKEELTAGWTVQDYIREKMGKKYAQKCAHSANSRSLSGNLVIDKARYNDGNYPIYYLIDFIIGHFTLGWDMRKKKTYFS